MKLTKTKLIWLFKDLAQRIGAQPTKKQWIEDAQTPSDMPIRMSFGNWNSFVIACGYKPNKPYLSELAKKNSALAHKGRRSFNWKGGRIKDRLGYIQIWKPEHPNAKMAGYIHEHRLVMSQYLNRPLKTTEHVHHKNGLKDDNRVDNLEIVIKKNHKGELICPHCGGKYLVR